MKLRRFWWVGAFCASLTWATAVYAQAKDEKKPAEKPAAAQPPAGQPAKPAEKPADKPATPPKPGEKPGAPAGTPDMEAMMKAMQAESAPGKEHEALKPLVGSFACTTKMYPGPGAPPNESTGEVTRKWILGNRYVQEDVKATFVGMPFEGMGIMGYDRLQKMYHTYWVDSMGTGTWTMTGAADAAGKVITLSGENFDPMSKTKKKGKSTLDMTDANKHLLKMYDTGPDGKEFLGFEMTCTRK